MIANSTRTSVTNVMDRQDPSSMGSKLVGHHVHLRAISPKDYDYIYHLDADPAIASRWRFRGATPSPEEAIQSLWTNVLAQFLVVTNDTSENVGLVNCHDPDFQNRLAYFAVIQDNAYRRTGLALRGLALLFDYVFDAFDLRKLYAEVMEPNVSQFGSARSLGLRTEGILADFAFYNGAYCNKHILSLSRGDWVAFRSGAGHGFD